MISGTVYGVALNDHMERSLLSDVFHQPPYDAQPVAPVVYIKPRTCISVFGAPIRLDTDVDRVAVSATVALLIARDSKSIGEADALSAIGAAALAVDASVPHNSFYRPALMERCRDGSLPIGEFAPFDPKPFEITTIVDGKVAHRWSLERLVRPVAKLIADLTEFMTLCAGDVLLVGIPGDAPIVGRGQTVAVSGGELPGVSFRVDGYAA